MWNLDATMLEWQHDPAQIATFEWLWQEEGHTAADWPKVLFISSSFPHAHMLVIYQQFAGRNTPSGLASTRSCFYRVCI